MIYHLAERSTWEAARAAGAYTGSTRDTTLEEEGFIHCSFADQVDGVLERYYADLDPAELLLLTIDEMRLTSPVKIEHGYPHIYGPLNIDAVAATAPVNLRS